MSKEIEIARAVVGLRSKSDHISRTERTRMVTELAKHFEDKYSPIRPLPEETCVVASGCPKTAALFFDRVWSTPAGGLFRIPEDIVFFGGSKSELWMVAAASVLAICERKEFSLTPADALSFYKETPLPEYFDPFLGTKESKAVSNILFSECGIHSSPMFDDKLQMDREYKPGNTECTFAAIANLDVVNEKELDWKQVVDFRKDGEAKQKLRRMRHWLDSEMGGKPTSFVSDAIAIRLDDYDRALKKHGIQTVTGTLSELLDPKLLSATVATAAGLGLAGGEFWAALGAVGIIAGKAAVSVTQKLVDLSDRKHGQGSEVAFVHELKKLTK